MTINKHILFILLGIVLTYTSLGTALLFDPTVTTSYLEIAAVAETMETPIGLKLV